MNLNPEQYGQVVRAIVAIQQVEAAYDHERAFGLRKELADLLVLNGWRANAAIIQMPDGTFVCARLGIGRVSAYVEKSPPVILRPVGESS